MATSETPANKENGKANAIASVLTSANTDSIVKIGTLALVIISGGGNFFATKETGRATDDEVRSAVAEIHKLYLELDTYRARQKDMKEMLENIERNTRKQ